MHVPMTTLIFTLLVATGSFFAGLLGALTGLGGGVVIVPLLAWSSGSTFAMRPAPRWSR